MRDNPGPRAPFAAAAPRRRFSPADAFVLAGLLSYCAWWLYFLAHGRFPPAPLRAFTGLPAPSTGCIRSLTALLHGHFITAFAWNPFSVPILVLLIVSVVWLLARALARRALRLPNAVFALWVVLLSAAWIAKFILGPQYW